MNVKKFRNQDAFTLIEILVVIAILAIIAVVVFVALNPAQRFQDARDSRRVNDVNSILTAIHECIVDSDGSITACVGAYTAGDTYEIVYDAGGGAPATLCNSVCTSATDATHCLALDTTLASYLKSIPVDPNGPTGGHTNYSLSIDGNNLVSIGSCSAEGGPIEASR